MNGTIEVREIESAALRGNPLGDPVRRRTPVYLPPGYATSKERYPVVYFLHGFGGAGMQWLNFSGFTLTVPERIDQLIAKGTVPPFIGVFIDGWTAIGGTQWENSEAIGAYRDYVAKDVVAWADRELRTIPKRTARACMGKSSGGYGALVMGRSHPDVFAHIASHSGDAYFEYCYLHDFPKAAAALLKAGDAKAWFEDYWRRSRETKPQGADFPVLNILAMAAQYSQKRGEPMNLELPFDPQTARVREEVWARWLEKDPVRFIPRAADAFRSLETVFVDCGTKDEFNLRWGARMVAEELRKIGVAVVHEEFEDGHMQTSYRYDRSLALIVPKLARG
ncbi:MAG: alpha/beta hydrolase [Myxococcaceae bacterium]|nr:alpha/beta hydrolase [Myxococcaceae bacterium]